MKIKYTHEYLKILLEKDKAELIGVYDTLNYKSIINFKCNCGNIYSKKFLVLEKHNAYCIGCSKENASTLNSIKKKELSENYWDNIKKENKLTCIKCNEEKSLDNYNKRGERWEKECYICNKRRKTKETYNRKENGTIEYNLQYLLKEIEHRSKIKNKLNLINIDLNYLKLLYNEQKGLCKYSGRLMTFKINSFNHISVDRIDNNKWYEKGNIALCCSFVNKMKNNISLNEFSNFIKDINNVLNS